MSFNDGKPIGWVGKTLDGKAIDINSEMAQYEVSINCRQSFDFYQNSLSTVTKNQ